MAAPPAPATPPPIASIVALLVAATMIAPGAVTFPLLPEICASTVL
ncbi:MAG: hypothetical protein SGJ19_09480 [Planctomycetia bacterium]|nr:hypothetical protein [Planctomycetia bacterium]